MTTIRLRDDRAYEATALAGVGGFLDAYTFLSHGGVFANAQTGNIVLFGIFAGQGEWSEAARRVPPLVAFLVGMVTVEALARLRQRPPFHRPTRIVLLVECVVFLAVGLLPSATPDWVGAVAIAWAATLQVGTFRQVRHTQYNTTFTTGNLRSLVSLSAAWLADHDEEAGRRARVLQLIVGAFVVGAVVGGLATHQLHDHAVLLVVPVLLVVLASIVRDTRATERPAA